MWETVWGWYQEPLFLAISVFTPLLAALAFLTFALPLTALAWKDPESLRKHRIQSRQPDPRRVILPSLRHFLHNTAWVLGAVVVLWPLLRLSGIHGGPSPSFLEIGGQVLLFVFVDDFLYYFTHRAMHQVWLYRRIHSVHHRMVTPWAITGNYMHPAEFLVTSGLVLLGPLLLGSHLFTLWTWVVVRQWEASEGHCGYAFPWNPSRLLPFFSQGHHDFHHARFQGNYAGYLGWVDRAMGTVATGYEEWVGEKGKK